MNAEVEHADAECRLSPLLIVSTGSFEPSRADSESVVICVRPWKESSFTLRVHTPDHSV